MRIAIDFDGTISKYIPFNSPRGGEGKYGEPTDDCIKAITKLYKEYEHHIIIWTSRGHHENAAIEKYLDYYGIPYNYIATAINHDIERGQVGRTDCPRKIVADVYIDDKAIQFNGAWDDEIMDQITRFRPWWTAPKQSLRKKLKAYPSLKKTYKEKAMDSLRENAIDMRSLECECEDITFDICKDGKLSRGVKIDEKDYDEGSGICDSPSIHQHQYEKVVEELTKTRFEKCQKYGEDRYNVDDDEFNYWMCFSDVYRKHIRIKQLTKLAIQGDEDAHKSLRDAYADLANYGIMGVQILDQIKEKK